MAAGRGGAFLTTVVVGAGLAASEADTSDPACRGRQVAGSKGRHVFFYPTTLRGVLTTVAVGAGLATSEADTGDPACRGRQAASVALWHASCSGPAVRTTASGPMTVPWSPAP